MCQMQSRACAPGGSCNSLKVVDVCIGDGTCNLTDPSLKSQLIQALGGNPWSVIEVLRNVGGAHNSGMYKLTSPSEDYILKLVTSQPPSPGLPTEAEHFVRLSCAHPTIVDDSEIAFPHRIVRLRGSRHQHRFDLIVMRQAPGRALSSIISEKWRSDSRSDVLDLLERTGGCLRRFHQRYAGKQHGDLTPTNIFYDEISGCMTFIDIGGMSSASSESDVDYFAKNLRLSAQYLGAELETQGLQRFHAGYTRTTHSHVQKQAYEEGTQVQYHSSSGKWIDAKVVKVNTDGTYDLDCKANVSPIKIRAPSAECGTVVYSVGNAVEYYSTSRNSWISAKVLATDIPRGTCDLDCKTGVSMDRVRPPSASGNSTMLLYSLGEKVAYLSVTQQKWIPAIVTSINQDGTYHLDCKQCVAPDKIRRTSLIAAAAQ